MEICILIGGWPRSSKVELVQGHDPRTRTADWKLAPSLTFAKNLLSQVPSSAPPQHPQWQSGENILKSLTPLGGRNESWIHLPSKPWPQSSTPYPGLPTWRAVGMGTQPSPPSPAHPSRKLKFNWGRRGKKPLNAVCLIVVCCKV